MKIAAVVNTALVREGGVYNCLVGTASTHTHKQRAVLYTVSRSSGAGWSPGVYVEKKEKQRRALESGVRWKSGRFSFTLRGEQRLRPLIPR